MNAPFSGFKFNISTLKMEEACFSATSVSAYKITLRHRAVCWKMSEIVPEIDALP
jgi:hypothetical protein